MHIACDCLFVGGHNRRLNNQIKVCGVLLSLSLSFVVTVLFCLNRRRWRLEEEEEE